MAPKDGPFCLATNAGKMTELQQKGEREKKKEKPPPLYGNRTKYIRGTHKISPKKALRSLQTTKIQANWQGGQEVWSRTCTPPFTPWAQNTRNSKTTAYLLRGYCYGRKLECWRRRHTRSEDVHLGKC